MIFSNATTSFAALASVMAIAQADMLLISNPTKGTTWKVGETVFLQWKGSCASMGNPGAKSVDVNLMSGPDTALRFVAKLASIDCSGTETRKEFMIPADVVAQSGNYSLQVQTEPQLSYSNSFTIETAAGAASIGAAGGSGASAADGNSRSSVAGTDVSAHHNASPLKNIASTAMGSAVALVAVFIAAQLL
ncbi:hypothetical protein BGZ54_006815 [Gamsiella multidivaricata]|nr:hypothetical protein BGZ54_006815 [Gamsiella multidivaricata]